ncbi:activator-dependent family glycosyltransferase [Nocardiopsis dassonvillei]|uniref:activator-dependent family glycosyltransferase n=1 Tax=Nocardiopsis dassonvillei TaxID=2014 RepID=UPI00362FC85C
MKVLFTCIPAPTHLYPMVPLAWALRTAGHEVRVAGEPDLVPLITGCGLTAVRCGDSGYHVPADDPDTEQIMDELYEDGETHVFTFDLTGRDREQWSPEGLLALQHIQVPALMAVINNEPFIDDLVAFTREWRPDLVIWDPHTFAGAVAARVTDTPHARIMYTPDTVLRVRKEFLRQQAELPVELREDPTAEWLEWTVNRYGATFDEELVTGQWTIDQAPASTRLDLGLRTVGMRHVPHNGPSVVPDWLRRAPRRRRVAVTLGVSGAMSEIGALVSTIAKAMDGLDIEIVMTEDPKHPDLPPELPADLHLVGFVPLDDLLETCAAVVHHGGSSTLALSELRGIPQVILAPEEIGAARIEELGAGLTIAELTAATLREALTRVLDEPSFGESARRIREEVLDEPTPNGVVPLLEELVREHRDAVGTGPGTAG